MLLYFLFFSQGFETDGYNEFLLLPVLIFSRASHFYNFYYFVIFYVPEIITYLKIHKIFVFCISGTDILFAPFLL